MNGISHKQARRYIHALKDHILKTHDKGLLDEHLSICNECQAYFTELTLFESKLQKAFHNKWDEREGPSDLLARNIQSKSRRIFMTNRINLGIKTLGAVTILLIAGFLFSSLIQKIQNQPANIPLPTHEPQQRYPSIATNKSNGEWIAFIGEKAVPAPDTTALDITQGVYMIHPDGTGLINIINNEDLPGLYLYNLQWSYDGKHLTVLKKVNDEMILVRITQYGGGETMKPFTDPDNYGYSWSPTSYKVVFADASSGNYDIYTVYQDGRNDPELRQLTNDPSQDVGFVWSPDGNQIAFERLDGEKLSVHIMNEDGSNQREIAHGLGKVKLRWSQDGKSIYASSTENSMLDCEACLARPGIYQINLESQFVRQIYTEQTTRKVQAWYMYDTPQNMLYFMRTDSADFLEFWGTWMYTDGNSVRELGEMDPHQTCKTTTGNILNEHISPNERFSIISNYCAGGFDLYLADRETSNPGQKLTHILRLPLDTLGQGGDSATLPIRWSPDGRWLVYDDGRGSTYFLNVEKAIQEQDTKLSILIQPKFYTNPSGTYQSPDSISVVELIWQPKP